MAKKPAAAKTEKQSKAQSPVAPAPAKVEAVPPPAAQNRQTDTQSVSASASDDTAKEIPAPALAALLSPVVSGEVKACGISKSPAGYTVHEFLIRDGLVVAQKVIRGPTSRSLARAYMTRQGVAAVIL